MKRMIRYLRFPALAIVAGVVAILFIRGRNSQFARRIAPNSPAEAALNQTLDSVQIDDMTLEQAIAALSAQAHVPIHLRKPEDLVTVGLDHETLSLHARRTTLAWALRRLLDQFDADVRERTGQTFSLGLWPEGGIVQIDDPSESVRVCVYDLRNIPFDAGWLEPAPVTDNGWHGFFTESEDRLVDLVTETVGPDSWVAAGGSNGRIGHVGTKLIVSQTWENQQAVLSLLQQLRDSSPKPPGAPGWTPAPVFSDP
jgi:hypothetical protein